MQGYPTICMKIKGKKNSCRGYPTMFMKTGDLTVISNDIDENKPLNTRSALAQRAMLSGFIVCSPRREFTSRNGGLKLPLRGRHYGRPAGGRSSSTHPDRPPISQSFTLMRQPARIGNRQPTTDNKLLPPRGRTVADVESGGIKEIIKLKVVPNG